MATQQPQASSSTGEGNLLKVKGLVAVITEGGSGISLVMARTLDPNGASKVCIIGRRKEVLEPASKSIPNPGRIIPLVGDVTSQSLLSSLVSQPPSD
ncbi:hypothetical protein BJ875DRAFT_243712 [Amylocarpus encephaloides]|uniref:Uncharacterized protein n=1 Tax=Amylocarpus encephaloides TaxID=45428 RepID=A0A9P7YSW4_9HELO|nr:hypothetical protein BJ875DRAFT_243712 [Amylocarpus encephaloides]